MLWAKMNTGIYNFSYYFKQSHEKKMACLRSDSQSLTLKSCYNSYLNICTKTQMEEHRHAYTHTYTYTHKHTETHLTYIRSDMN